jgi:SEC-C motif-containing protein
MAIFCPCDTGKLYEDCCQKLHNGAFPENALTLMRSRYSAYALQLAAYIIRTTHLKNPHYDQDHRRWTREILRFCQNTIFQKLEILDFIDGEDEAYVTFDAHLFQNKQPLDLIEKSHFEKVNRQWLYRDACHITHS